MPGGPATTAAATAATTTASSPPPSILRQSISVLLLSLPSLLLLSLLLLSLRSSLLAGNLRLSSLPETNPLLRSLLSRLSSPSPNPQPPFFHLSPSLPFPDHFFPSSSSPPLSQSSLPNSSLIPIFLSLNSTALTDPRVRVTANVRNPPSNILFSLSDSSPDGDEQQGFSLRKDGIRLIHLLSLLSSAHTAAILAFLLCHATAFGVVFYCVATNALSRPTPSLIDTIRCGAGLGVRRLVGFVFLKWAIRDAIVQLLCILFFSNVEDQNKLFKLFVKAKLMPFSLTVSAWDEGDELLPGFLVVWGALDFVVSVILVLVPWIVVVDDVRTTGQEVVKEGAFLVSLVSTRCVWIKCVEVVLSGRLGRLFFAAFGGRRFAMWAQAMLEVYFMVVWLVVYLEARRKDFELGGRRFGREELERCIDRL